MVIQITEHSEGCGQVQVSCFFTFMLLQGRDRFILPDTKDRVPISGESSNGLGPRIFLYSCYLCVFMYMCVCLCRRGECLAI